MQASNKGAGPHNVRDNNRYSCHNTAMAAIADSDYLEDILGGADEETLASILECTVEELYELLAGDRELTMEHIDNLSDSYDRTLGSVFRVACQLANAINNHTSGIIHE
jgi:plasmid maintenance system antidote protein VapI